MPMDSAVSSLPTSSRAGSPADRGGSPPRLTLVGAEGPLSELPASDPRPDVHAGGVSWSIDPDLCFLNHGSYGSVVGSVLEAQRSIRDRMERDPVRFFKVDLEELVDRSRTALGTLVGCHPEDLAPLRNATVGLCTIFNNYPWRAGDEILVTDHEYSSGQYELERIAQRHGVSVIQAHVPFPLQAPGQVVEAVVSKMTGRTRMVMISHVTSCSSLIFPVEAVAAECSSRGIDILIDGAHSPGQVPVDIRRLDPAFYVGSLHKWVGAPRGASFVYVRPDLQAGFRTIALSSRAKKIRPARSLFLRDFDYMGTDDYSAFLVVADAIDALGGMDPGGVGGLMVSNHRRVIHARDIVCAMTGLTPSCPDEMTGSMVSLVLPEAGPEASQRPTRYDDPLQDALVERHGVQAPIWRLWENPGVRVARLSAQVYNRPGQYAYFARALAEELAREH
ncbi:MAG: aminotransferase class V-fold PLP-dependent enzyme [Phycisphaerales bacterium]|nr:aminotransferase class V-fold PLP-dependent enzyme [Phycisphaerales bacterium]